MEVNLTHSKQSIRYKVNDLASDHYGWIGEAVRYEGWFIELHFGNDKKAWFLSTKLERL